MEPNQATAAGSERPGSVVNSNPARSLGQSLFRVMENILVRLLGRNAGAAAVEYVAGISPALSRVYCATRECLVRTECDYFLLSGDVNIEDYAQVVMVGGGAVPFTAMHWAGRYGGRIVVLEKIPRTARHCRRLVDKLGLSNVQVLCQDGNEYQDYDKSLVLLSLHVTGKQSVVERIMRSGPGNKAICLRLCANEPFQFQPAGWRTLEDFGDFKVLAVRIGASRAQTPDANQQQGQFRGHNTSIDKIERIL